MAPKKRKACDSASSTPPSAKKNKACDLAPTITKDWMQKCLTYFDENIASVGGIPEFLAKEYDTLEKRTEFAKQLNTTFKPKENTQ